MTDDYNDIIGLPHPVSRKHPRMALAQRAAQFAPFAALNGHDEALRETARQTDDTARLDGRPEAELDRKLAVLCRKVDCCPLVTFTYFEPDAHKAGGTYRSFTKAVKAVDLCSQTIRTTDRMVLDLSKVADMQGRVFEEEQVYETDLFIP